MMRVSKEVRTGILVTVALLIFFIGFYFLKGANVFASDKEYYCLYTNVQGLQNSANVQIHGMNIGHVSHMELLEGKGVRVAISLNKSVDVPTGTVANLASFDLLGTKMISLDLGKGPGMIPAGSQLQSGEEVGLVDKMSGELTPRLQELKVTIASLNSALTGINRIVNNDNQAAIAASVQSIKATAENLSKLTAVLSNEGGEISNILHHANSVTENLAKSNDTVRHILSNMNTITRQLANAPIQKTFTDLQKTSAQLQGIIEKINNNQGSLGMLINNKDVYNSLNSSIKSINNLTDDIKVHPARYINVSVFGKKTK